MSPSTHAALAETPYRATTYDSPNPNRQPTSALSAEWMTSGTVLLRRSPHPPWHLDAAHLASLKIRGQFFGQILAEAFLVVHGAERAEGDRLSLGRHDDSIAADLLALQGLHQLALLLQHPPALARCPHSLTT